MQSVVLVVFFSLLAAINVVLASPFQHRRMVQHHAIAARAPVPVVENPVPVLRKRQVRGSKCRADPTSSSVAVPAVAPTSSAIPSSPAAVSPPADPVAVAPTPATTSIPAADNTPVSTGGGSAPGGYLAGTQTGDITYYTADGGRGSCGTLLDDKTFFAALAIDAMKTYPGAGANPNLNPICGKNVKVTYGGKTITVPILDSCPGCSGSGLDLSLPAFTALLDPGVGRAVAAWEWA